MRRYEYGAPAVVLERRGEDCTNCQWLIPWRFAGQVIEACDNLEAPADHRADAPAKRCDQWRHVKADEVQR